jgi:hypothetical protein
MLRSRNDLIPTLRQLPDNDAKNDGYSICTKKNTKKPQLNCQPEVSKLRVVELCVPRKKG